jgi:hypothetical protein
MHLSMTPKKNSEPKHLKIEGTSHARKSNENSPNVYENRLSHKKEIDATMNASIHSVVRFSTKQ